MKNSGNQKSREGGLTIKRKGAERGRGIFYARRGEQEEKGFGHGKVWGKEVRHTEMKELDAFEYWGSDGKNVPLEKLPLAPREEQNVQANKKAGRREVFWLGE